MTALAIQPGWTQRQIEEEMSLATALRCYAAIWGGGGGGGGSAIARRREGAGWFDVPEQPRS